MAQILLPIADQATGSWSNTPLWSKVDDDSTVNPTGDGTTITSDDNKSPDNADLELTNTGVDNPDTGNHILRARWNKDASGGHSINAVCELWQGIPGTGTLIATLSVTGIGETETESTYTLNGTEVGNITDYNDLYLRVSRQGDTGGNPNGRRSLVVDLVEFEIPDAAAASGRIEASWAEVETPHTPSRLEASWTELEVPNAPGRIEVSWAELESPHTPTRLEASWAELEAPHTASRIEVSWAEVESPHTPTRLESSWVEVETPHSPSRLETSWAELEAPSLADEGRLEASWAELEVTDTPSRIEASWSELETPHSASRLETSWVEFETADTPSRIEASWVEVETPHSPSRLETSWTEFETPDSATRLEVSWVELEVPNVGGGSKMLLLGVR